MSSPSQKQKYEIGTKFKHYARRRIHTIVDVHKTYNSKGELVAWHYIVEDYFMGQRILGEFPQTGIDRSEIIKEA